MNIGVSRNFLTNMSFKANNSSKNRHHQLMKQAERDRSIREDYFEKNYSKSANTQRKREGRMQYIVPIASTATAVAIALGVTSGINNARNNKVEYPTYVPPQTAIVETAPTQTPTPYDFVVVNRYDEYQTGLNGVIEDEVTLCPEFKTWFPNTTYTTMNNELNKILNGDLITTEDKTPHLKNYISAHLMHSFFENLEGTNRFYINGGRMPENINIIDEVIYLCEELTNGEVSPNLVFALMNQASRGLVKDNEQGATGLMQVSQVAEDHMNQKYFSSNPKDRHNPMDNLALGIKYIHYLQQELGSKYSGDELIQRIVIGYKDGHTVATRDYSKINENTINYAKRTTCFYNCLNEIEE